MKKKWCVVILSFLAGMLLLQTQTVKADDYTVDMTLLKTGHGGQVGSQQLYQAGYNHGQ